MRYIVIYVGAPVSTITHYGKIKDDGILFDESAKRYTILLDGPAEPLIVNVKQFFFQVR